MKGEYWIGKDLEGCGSGLLKVLSLEGQNEAQEPSVKVTIATELL
jgi:hypothetical protein